MAADKMKEILKHFPDLENGWKEMKEKLKAEPELLSLKFRETLQRESSKESLVESEFTKAKRADSDLKVMKANAPEKLYFGESDKGILYIYSNRESNDEVEYTRTDAFIEKAEEFIYSALNDGIMDTANIEDFMRLFKNYMKGE